MVYGQNKKLFIGIAILFAYISIGLFGLFQFSHLTETPMENCPYIQNSYSICENTLDHIAKWQQFSSVIFSSMFISLFLILGIILYFLNQQNFLRQQHYFYKWKYFLYDKKLHTYSNRIIKWLSLFENSPSFLYLRHS